MVIELGTLITLFLFLVGAIIGAYGYVFRRTKDVEDCVEGRLEKMQTALHDFEKEALQRLARIEALIEKNGKSKKGASGSHSE